MSDLSQNSIAVIIVAAGRGRRLGGDVPKQYRRLGGREVLARTIEGILSHPRIGRVVTVIHPDDRGRYDAAMAGLGDARLLPPVAGGQTRSASVLAGLEALTGAPPDFVLIHDAARPFLSAEVIDRVISALSQADGAFAALPVVDALWRVADGRAVDPVSREAIWRAQTPQGFRFDAILAAHRATDAAGADDVEIARRAGLEVAVVEGAEENFKITTPGDLARAEAMLTDGKG